MNKKYSFLHHLWNHESGLFGMLLLLMFIHFILIPIFGSYTFFRFAMNIFWMLFLTAGIFALAENRKKALLTSIIPILFVIVSWVSYFYESPLISISDFILTICTSLLLTVLVLVKVFESGPITGYRIAGSIVVYMLLATIWAEVYIYLYNNIDEAFQFTLPKFKSNSIYANFMYFSYITITTTGYGEILPLHPFARSLVQLEAFTGVLYPVILIGRLVSDAGSIRKK